MTPEELNPTIEFIIASQARMSARQEQEKQWTEDMFAKMERTDARLARVSEELTRLVNHQSERMDRIDKLHSDWVQQNHEVLELQREALRLLKRILDKLPSFPPNPN
jgi:chromosome segregation ATPase